MWKIFNIWCTRSELTHHLNTLEDQMVLRNIMQQRGLVAFFGNGSMLPRVSGVDDRKMDKGIPFKSPPSLEVEVNLPHIGKIKGMGIKKGITLIVGGGFHGKSTLLQALQVGVYEKVPYDGREFVLCDQNAVKIRAEDGRSVKNVDISPFINNLPLGQDTTHFSTADASGSTSQAANIMESLEAGARLLLLDEDTCASNFMIRDARMQALIAQNKEPIMPFINKVIPLYSEKDVSTIMVVGGTGDFFEVADCVIQMEKYEAKDVTQQAWEISKKFSKLPDLQITLDAADIKRKIVRNGLAANGKASAKGLRCISYGEQEIELTYIEQLVDIGQARALCDIAQWLGDNKSPIKDSMNFVDLLDFVEKELIQGFDIISWHPQGFYAMPRRFEIAATLNRLRSARFN